MCDRRILGRFSFVPLRSFFQKLLDVYQVANLVFWFEILATSNFLHVVVSFVQQVLELEIELIEFGFCFLSRDLCLLWNTSETIHASFHTSTSSHTSLCASRSCKKRRIPSVIRPPASCLNLVVSTSKWPWVMPLFFAFWPVCWSYPSI